MSDTYVQLHPGSGNERDLKDDPDLLALAVEEAGLEMAGNQGQDWDEPFDLRVNRPRAIDLRKLWALTKQPEPPGITASLGPNIPILVEHVITPFPVNGKAPGKVWALGYEFVPHDVDANTVSVMPNDEVVEIGKIGQEVDFGIELGGKIGVPDSALTALAAAPAVSLTNASLRASTNQRFQFSLQMKLTLRKVVGAGFGVGGAQWKLYRQDEAIDKPHALMQTLLVAEGTKSIRCTVRSWAKQAGFLGTRLGAKFWQYPDQTFEISLAGL